MDPPPWVAPKPARKRTVTLISSAGLGVRGQKPFRGGESGYRVIPHQTPAAEILMSHVSVNFDRTGYQLDLETILPRERLQELADAGAIGAVAREHYSFMGATDPAEMEPQARELAGQLHKKGVDTAILLPV